MTETKKFLLPAIIAIAIFIENLDSTIVSVAIPSIAHSFGISAINMKLALTSYLLSLSVFIPISGWIADRFSDKYVFTTAIILFTFFSILCALSTNLTELVLARMGQGIGGAFLMPIGRLILLRAYTKAEFGKAVNIGIIPGILGAALGPTVGGLVIKLTSWHWIFLINVPVGILGIIVTYYAVSKSTKNTTLSPFNWSGFMLFSIGLSAFTFSMALIGDKFSLLPYSAALLAISILAFIAYGWLSKKQIEPLLNLKLLKENTFRSSILLTLFARPSIGSLLFLIPLLLQIIWQKSPVYTGSVLMFFALGMMCSRALLGNKLLTHYGFKKSLYIFVSITLVLQVSLLWFVKPQPFYLLAIVLLLIGGVASQLYSGIGTLLVMGTEKENYSQSISIYSTIQQVALGFGISAAAICLHVFSLYFKTPLFSSNNFFATFILLTALNLCSLLSVTGIKNSQLKLPT